MIYGKLVIDGNAVYEIDENCLEKRKEQLKLLEQQQKGAGGEKRKNSGK
ncbi:MAG: hypothetical protein HFG49_03800 [Lachnospiraceae bacterium]|jgi:hypothetical protein|nr:hypothetical protein [Lachnospiraceae bacterium]